MGLEVFDQIPDMNAAWPLGTDGLNQADDHIRGVKATIQTQLNSLGVGAVNNLTVTGQQINEVVGAGITPPPETKRTQFTADGTWTKTAGMLSAKVTVTAAGGGGGDGSSTDPRGGGGAGGTVIAELDISAIASSAITVGTGGAGGTGDGAGGNGGASSYIDGVSTLTAGGGSGSSVYDDGTGGTAAGGDTNIGGGDGMNAISNSSGTGGASFYGGGGGGRSNGSNGRAGVAYGSGGGGGAENSTSGGAGAGGLVIIEESSAALV